MTVGQHQIGPAVEVGVEELRSKPKHVQGRPLELRRGADVLEQPAGPLPVKHVVFVVEIGDEQVEQAVAVGVVNGNAHRCHGLAFGIHGAACQLALLDEGRQVARVVGLVDE